MIEDQLLEKNLIFQGLHETEYEDKNELSQAPCPEMILMNKEPMQGVHQ